MLDSRGWRFALEVLFLVALAIVLALADLRPIEIGGIMLVGWVIVAALEWAAWREEPHYGSGLPPRYYVPQVSLPPAQPLEQVSVGYPEARDEAPTWIASAALREEMLGGWPVAVQAASRDEEPEPPLGPEPPLEPEPQLDAERPPAEHEPEGEPEPPPEPEPQLEREPQLDAERPAPEHEPEVEPDPWTHAAEVPEPEVAEAEVREPEVREPEFPEPEVDPDPWTLAEELPAAPLG